MKKIYLSLAAMVIGGSAVAQAPQLQIKDNVHAKQAITEKPVTKTTVAEERGTPLYSYDFSTASNWSFNNTSNPPYDWAIVTQTNASLQSQGFDAAINSPSGNEFAYIDSDAEGSAATQNANLVLTQTLNFLTNASVVLKFYNYHRRYQETHTVQVSNDGGTTWDDYVVNGQYAVNTTSPNAELVSVNITATAALQSSVMVRWNYQGAWDWFWCVDDVSFYEAPPHDISMISNEWATFGVPYTKIPTDQASDASFPGIDLIASFANDGANSESNVTLAGSIWDGGTQFSAGTGTSGTVAVGGTHNDTVNLASPTAVGTYLMMWDGEYDDMLLDDDASNDTATGPYWITNFEYARDYQDWAFSGGGLWNGAGNGYVMGPEYDMYATNNLTAIRCALNGSTAAGVFIYGQVYQVDQATGDFVLVYDGSGTVDGEIEVTSGMISSGSSVTWVDLPIQGGSFTMQAGEIYIVCVGHYGGPDDALLLNGGVVAPAQTVFILDATDQTWYYMTSTPTVRAVFDPSVGIAEETANLTLGQNMPNPFDGITTINYSLNENADVAFEVTDVTGKVVERIDLGSVSAGEHNIQLNADSYSKGVYFYTMTAGTERLTKQMVITK